MNVLFLTSLVIILFQYSTSNSNARHPYNHDNLNENDEDYPGLRREELSFLKHSEKMLHRCLNVTSLLKESQNQLSETELKEIILKMTLKEKLEAFQNSNCPPIILIPGFLATKLEFRMKNCTEFQTYHQNIMDSCGWSNCNKKELKKFTVWINVHLDIGDMFGGLEDEEDSKTYIPNMITSFTIEGSEFKMKIKEGCLGNLFRVYHTRRNISQEGGDNYDYEVTNLKGAEIVPMSTSKHLCGSNSVSKVLGDDLPRNRMSDGFLDFNHHLLKMGYISGLNLFYIPYDFRMPHTNTLKIIDKAVKSAYEITKKKPVLIGHSLGGVLSYKYSLNNSNLIKEVMTIDSPFLGASSAVSNIFSINLFDYESKVNVLGFDIKIQSKLDNITANLIKLTFPNRSFLPKLYLNDVIDKEIAKIGLVEGLTNTYAKNELKEQFMKLASKKENNFLKYLYNIFPKIYSYCKSTSFENACKINYKDISSSPIINLNNEEISIYSPEFMKEFRQELKKQILDANINVHEIFNLDPEEFIEYLFSEIKEDNHGGYTQFKNPTIPFTFVYSNHMHTPYKFYFKDNKIIKQENVSGDGTVYSISQIYPGLRWMYEKYVEDENDFNKADSAPIHFVEYCAEHKNSLLSTYDKTKTQYLSISCACLHKPYMNPKENCDHSSMLSDNYLISFFEEFIEKSNSKVEMIPEYQDLYQKKFSTDMMCSHLKLR